MSHKKIHGLATGIGRSRAGQGFWFPPSQLTAVYSRREIGVQGDSIGGSAQEQILIRNPRIRRNEHYKQETA